MPKVNSRRRLPCAKCGIKLSNRWLKEHRDVCGQAGKKSPDKECDGAGLTVSKERDVEAHKESDSEDEDLHDVDASQDNTCCSDDDSMEQEHSNSVYSDSSDDSYESNDDLISDDIRDQLSTVLEQKRLGEEDADFFEEEDMVENISDSSTNVEPPIETWDDSVDDINADVNTVGNSITVDRNEMQESSKIEVLVLWLVLFITSWQSNFGVTDTALSLLLQFLCKLFYVIGTFDSTMESLARVCPKTLYKLKQMVGLSQDDFTKYVVCPKCKSIYKFEDCIEVRNGKKVSAKCKYQAWPLHPHRNKRGRCGEFLLKSARTGKGTILYPRMVYPYYSIINSLRNFLSRPGFWKKCQEWRTSRINVQENVKADVHHGDVWKELAADGFLSHPNSLGLMLNVDWFRPHKHSPGSVGVLYLVIMDLPRQERYKIENVLVAGIIPGPSEPKLTANTFLQPLVDDLQLLWQRKESFSVHGCLLKKRLRVGLVCVSCDIPACRKIGGFMGHMANQGCSRCKKEFYKDGSLNFSGFEREEWESRLSDEHKHHAKASLNETTPTQQQSYCSKNGARYSVLQELEYFDCIRYFVIDPMHNLYLGTAKNLMKIWQSGEIPLLGPLDFESIQLIIDETTTPQDVGRIPGKIEHNFGGFTADQWQSWTLIYSLPSLQGILPEKHLECWRLFVSSCKHFGKKVITNENICCGDEFMIDFLKEFVKLYGPDAVTPNMHLHCHLQECLKDYGPFHGFWCFSFERYNGILGSYHTNNRSIEIQLMRRFLAHINSKVYLYPSMYSEHFLEIFPEQQSEGSLKATLDPVQSLFAYQHHKSLSLNDLDCADWSDVSFIEPVPPLQDATLDSDDVRYLRVIYTKLLGLESGSCLQIPFTVSRFAAIRKGNLLYGSTMSRTLRNAYLLANWAGNEGQLTTNNSDDRSGETLYFFRHRVQVECQGSSNYHIFYMARINWFSIHPVRREYGSPMQIFCKDFDVFGPSCFMPVQRIKSRIVVAPGKFSGENVFVTTTLPGE